MKPPFEIIEFTFAGLTLQEPGAIISNWAITAFSLFAVFNTKWSKSIPSLNFKRFYLVLACSTFLSGFGHALFQYFGVFGKYPAWILAISSGFFVSKGILFFYKNHTSYSFLNYFLLIKSLTLLSLSLLNQTFLFIAIDSILTYLLYTGFIAGKLWSESMKEMKYFVYGIIVLFPSAFIFLMKINLHKYLNRDDLSHLLMLFCIIFFYVGIKQLNLKYQKN